MTKIINRFHLIKIIEKMNVLTIRMKIKSMGLFRVDLVNLGRVDLNSAINFYFSIGLIKLKKDIHFLKDPRLITLRYS